MGRRPVLPNAAPLLLVLSHRSVEDSSTNIRVRVLLRIALNDNFCSTILKGRVCTIDSKRIEIYNHKRLIFFKQSSIENAIDHGSASLS